MKSAEQRVKEILKIAGVNVNGKKPWDIQVHDERFYDRVLSENTLAVGESYMDGWWDVEKLDEFFNRVLGAELQKNLRKDFSFILSFARSYLLNLQSRKRAFEVGEKHYDIGNDLYKLMLDNRMIYSCGYWKNAKNLEEAQEAKLDLICKKIGLKKGDRVLDIGCGWGGFAKFAAERYKAKVVGVTVSKEQAVLAKKACQHLDVEIRVQDYRELNEKFEHVVSIGMFEHVGYKNYTNFMEVVNRNLKDDGLFLLHTIGKNVGDFSTDRWMDKYIFPNYMLPSPERITSAAEGIFILEDWHQFGQDYDKTLMAWQSNFEKNWPKLKDKYGERFKRMWDFYLFSCAGCFRSRQIRLWQIVFSKKGVPGGYKSVR